MSKHIGIVACSAEGAALCYRTICTEAQKLIGRKWAHPEVSLHTHPLDTYMDYIISDDWQAVADLMLDSAEKLHSIGAEFCICPDNTIHQAFNLFIEKSPVPWIHIVDAIKAKIEKFGYGKIGVLGTKYLMEGPVYTGKLDDPGIETIIPTAKERERIDKIIFDELVHGITDKNSVDYFIKIINRLKEDEGIEAVVLGCTEIPIIINDDNSSVPTLDSTRLLARAAIRHSLEE
jgi:aspartate racemase